MTVTDGSEGNATDLMRLVAHGLKVHGLCVCLPAQEDSYMLTVDITGAFCELLVSDDGYVEWRCRPGISGGVNPHQLTSIALFLLTGRAADVAHEDQVNEASRMALKSIVATEARALGLEAELEVYQDEELCQVTAEEVVLTNPASDAAGIVRVSDDGGIFWEHDFWPQVSGMRSAARTAGAIVTKLAPAILLAAAAITSASKQICTPSQRGDHRRQPTAR